MSTAKRLTPNKIANLVMADEAWHDSEYVAASDYDALSAELAALRAERDALRADAERYRWLRQNGSNSRVTEKDGFGGYCLKYDYDLDAAIDAVRGES